MAITFSALGERGRLGNQLWQVAASYGIAQGGNTQLYLPEWDYRLYFSCPDEWWEAPGSGPVFEADSDAYTCEHIDPRQRGYLQCWHYIERVVHDVRRLFQPSDLARELLDEHLRSTGQEWLNDYWIPESVSLHVRRGDNADPKTHPVGSWPLVTLDFYRDALNHIDPDHATSVVIFSDDIPWSRENLHHVLEGRDSYFVEDGPQRDPEYGLDNAYQTQPALDWIDMQLMSRCKHHILANSTYSWWGAFLDEQEDSKVVYPNHWVGWRIDQFEPRDLMPPHWTEINNPVHPKHLRKR